MSLERIMRWKAAALFFAAIAASGLGRAGNEPIVGGEDPYANLGIPAPDDLPPEYRTPTNKSILPEEPLARPLEEPGRTFRAPGTILAAAQPEKPAAVDEEELRARALAAFEESEPLSPVEPTAAPQGAGEKGFAGAVPAPSATAASEPAPPAPPPAPRPVDPGRLALAVAFFGLGILCLAIAAGRRFGRPR